MSKKKNKRRPSSRARRTNPGEAVLKKRARALIRAEREYWHRENTLIADLNRLREWVSDDSCTRLRQLSSVVWALRDGAALVRYEAIEEHPAFDFRVCDQTLQEWRYFASVPTSAGEVRMAPFVVAHGQRYINVNVNGFEIPYAEFALIKYGDSERAPSVERAVMDFQLTLLGLGVQDGVLRSPPGRHERDPTIAKLEAAKGEFAELLEGANKEEQLQTFLKDNPLVLDVGADVLPKRKLGEDFVTDFVLLSPTDQGPRYTLVEIERSDVPILTKEGGLSHHATHALKQTREWDVWVQRNSSYLREKLLGFESPEYLIVIGRSKDLMPEQKALLRSHNRDLAHTEFRTYDDVLAKFESVIEKLKLYCSS